MVKATARPRPLDRAARFRAARALRLGLLLSSVLAASIGCLVFVGLTIFGSVAHRFWHHRLPADVTGTSGHAALWSFLIFQVGTLLGVVMAARRPPRPFSRTAGSLDGVTRFQRPQPDGGQPCS